VAEELTRALVRRAERGSPRGPSIVFAAAQRQATTARRGRPRWRRGPAFALAVAAATLIVAGSVLLAARLLTPDTSPIATIPEPPTAPTPTVPSSGAGAADEVFDLALAPDGRLWAATAAGVVVWDLETASPTVFSEVDGLDGRSVQKVAVAADGTVWALVGDSGVARYDGTWTLLDDDVVGVDFLTPAGDMAAGPEGAVWVAAGGPSALIRIDTGGATTFQVPRESSTQPWARSIAVDPTGTVWASTWTDGVLAFDGEWHHFGVDDGLPSNIVGNIAVAPDGTVWVGGDGLYGDPAGDVPAAGIAHFEGSTWTSFTTVDGLLSNSGDVVVGPDGDVWVIHTSLPAEVADTADAGLPFGLSHYDGTRWLAYPGIPTGYGAGTAASADGTLWMPSGDGILGFDGIASRLLVAGADAVPPSGSPGPPLHLERVVGLEPVRLSTSIGQIEFTTWVHPDGEEPPWTMTETAHGVFGGMGPDGTPAWSLDGITWTEIGSSVEPSGWSDQLVAFGRDVVVWEADSAVGRATWDGTGWADVEILDEPRIDGASAVVVGPHGIVFVRNGLIYWDGTGFTEATRPPDPLLHPGSSPGCAGQEWLGWSAMAQLGPVAATDDGFIALAARSEDDWHTVLTCEPLVWLSTDGNEWVPTTDVSPFGEGAVVRDIAVAGDKIVAVGGMSYFDAAAWVSDDGVTWERTDLDSAHLLQVAGSARGWIAAGHGNTMWFSPDGRVWDGPYERPPGWSDIWDIVGVGMLDDRIIGVGGIGDAGPSVSAASGVVIGVFIDE
jgi:streptogramin lyase